MIEKYIRVATGMILGSLNPSEEVSNEGHNHHTALGNVDRIRGKEIRNTQLGKSGENDTHNYLNVALTVA
ncbi:hypothetical protein UB51_13105 [Paenibacillus sp. IHBB 10380]|nr:hypothetical protein UB51_13105 [Paenibacillus sp. IHBB 10380]